MPLPQHRLAIVRTLASPIDRRFYNSQELGLGRALLQHQVSTDVYVASTKSEVTETLIAEQGDASLKLLECPCRSLPLISQAWMPKVAQRLASTDYDLIHVNESNEIESWRIAKLARRSNVPLLLYQGMHKPIEGRLQSCFQAVFDRLMLPSLRHNTTIACGKTQRAAQYLEERGFAAPRVMPVGLDPTPLETDTAVDWREKLSIAKHTKMVLYVGVLEERRNPDLILELAARNPEFMFVIAGTGPAEQKTREECDRRQLKNLQLLGQVPQNTLPDLYRNSDLSLLPSDYEIYGMTVLESMYFGTPVMASRTAGPESIIDHDRNGWLIDSMSVDDWNQTLLQVTGSPTTLTDVAKAAEKKIHEKLTWKAIAEDYSALLETAGRS